MSTSKKTVSPLYKLPPIPFPLERKSGEIRSCDVEGKHYIHAEDLYHFPENEALYGKAEYWESKERPAASGFSSSLPELLKSFEELYLRRNNNQFAVQLQPVIVRLDGGVITGSTRVLTQKMWAAVHQLQPWVWVVFAEDALVDNRSPVSAVDKIKELLESNKTRQPRGLDWLRQYNAVREASCNDRNIAKGTPERLAAIESLVTSYEKTMAKFWYDEAGIGLAFDSLSMLDYVNRNENLLKKNYPELYQSGEWKIKIGVNKGIEMYYNTLKGTPGGIQPIPDQCPSRDWSGILTNERLRRAVTLTKDYIASIEAVTVPVDGAARRSNYAPFTEFESSGRVPVYSHAYNLILAEILRNDGFAVTTPATDSAGDFDLMFEFAGAGGLETDKVEIKFTTYDSGSTTWKGGHGIREGMFILVAVEGNWKSVFVAATRLSRLDWQSAGRVGTKVKVSTVLKNHRTELQYAAGNLIEKSHGVEVQTESL